MTLHAAIVTADLTYLGDQILGRPTPRDVGDGGLPGFLDRISKLLGPSGVVLVDGEIASRLFLPIFLPVDGEAKTHPAIEQAATGGWTTKEIYRWSRFRKGQQTVWVGLLNHIDQRFCPLISEWWTQDTCSALSSWHHLTGHPYWGDPGDAVNEIIRGSAKVRINGKPGTPTWWDRTGPADMVERTWTRGGWDRAGLRTGRYLHGYDAVRSYLSAMSIVEVAPLGLRHTGPRPFDKKQAGWWLVDMARWSTHNLDLMPDPAGPTGDRPECVCTFAELSRRRGDDDGCERCAEGQGDPDPGSATVRRWLTTPRLELIQQLTDQGVHGGFEVLDSHTSRADRLTLRPAAAILEESWGRAHYLHTPQDTGAVRETIKDGYHRMHGKWRSRQSEIQRPDWAATLAATAATTLWRRAWKTGNTVAAQSGRWPAYLTGIDTVYYASDSPDPYDNPPGGFNVATPEQIATGTTKLGQFVPKYVIDRTEEAIA